MRDPLRSLVVRFRELFLARRRFVLVGCLVAGVLFLFASNRDAGPGRHQTVPPASVGPMGGDPKEANALKSSHLQAELYRSDPSDSKTGMFLEPRIAYSAELSLTTRSLSIRALAWKKYLNAIAVTWRSSAWWDSHQGASSPRHSA